MGHAEHTSHVVGEEVCRVSKDKQGSAVQGIWIQNHPFHPTRMLLSLVLVLILKEKIFLK